MLFNIRNAYLLIYIVCLSFALVSCKKFLDEKPDQKLVVPTTIQDLQSLLDDYARINDNEPSAGEKSADDYYLTSGSYAALNEYDKRVYIWDSSNLIQPGVSNDWTRCYNKVYTANVVLDYIDKINSSNDPAELDNTKGIALFLRAKSFTQAAWIWSPAYDQATAENDLGIPLRLSSNFNTPTSRASVQQTYDQIIKDLKEAIQLLPINQIHVLRPSKVAAYGWLARVYLSMRNYDSALVYADKGLQLANALIDYNTLNSSGFPIISSYNIEVIYHSTIVQDLLYNPRAKVEPTLISMYDANDLRKSIMFQSVGSNVYSFQGSYHGSSWIDIPFNGIATDELYLIRSECLARKGSFSSAMNDLNTLMTKRWKNNGTFVNFSATNSNEAISKILVERRKELFFRGLRWIDIKRLNKEGANITLTRTIDNQTYTLLPNAARYALPIPEDVIKISGIKQNSR